MYLTTSYWTTEEDITHIFYDNHVPPGAGFGWSSFCTEVRLPIEQEPFELDKDVTEEGISCSQCRDRLVRTHSNLEDDALAGLNGCLFRVKRDEGSVIT